MITLEIVLWAPIAAMVIVTSGLIMCWRPWRRVARLQPEPESEPTATETAETAETADAAPAGTAAGLPRLSVIVYTEDGEDEIASCVEMLCAQDYPDKEIVVVCRTTAASREIISGRLAGHDNVYVTFIPPDSHNLSERKLAITLGLKAATGDIVLTTASNIRPASEHWLSDMARPFTNRHIEIVLGYSHMDSAEMRGAGRWYRQYDSLMTSGLWLGYALNGKPYRGDGFNLAFRRATFFAHKGYARNMFLHYGDDDLFVNEIAKAGNSAVVLNPGSIITTEWGASANRMWTLRKSRYQFTSRWLPNGPFVRASLVGWCNWLLLAALGASVPVGIAVCPYSIAVPAVCWIAAQLFQISSYRRMAANLGAVRLWWAVPLFLLAHPVLNFFFKINNHSLRKVNYTWQH